VLLKSKNLVKKVSLQDSQYTGRAQRCFKVPGLSEYPNLLAELEKVVGLKLLRVFREAEAVGYLQFFYYYNYSNILYFFSDKCYVLQLKPFDHWIPQTDRRILSV
jgi:hypothetical protein